MATASRSLAQAPVAEGPTESLRRRLEVGTDASLRVNSEPARARTALARFYEARAFAPAWTGTANLLPSGEELLRSIEAANLEGLTPNDYHLRPLRAMLDAPTLGTDGKWSPAYRSDLELLLTDAYLLYGAHLVSGRINPETIDAEWIAVRREVDLPPILAGALQTGEVRASLEGLIPGHPGYPALRKALARYRKISDQGGWPIPEEGGKLSPGDHDPRVPVLRRRLAAEGFAGGPAPSDSLFYEDVLRGQIIRFQERNGLDPDGVIGARTQAMLRETVEQRVGRIRVNLERWRWLPQDLGDRYILVNIADFGLRVVEGGVDTLSMKVIVGRDYRRTPVFSGRMTYLVFSPYWNVPRKLAVVDKLPLIRKDPGYLAAQGIRVFEGWGADAREVDPAGVDWTGVTSRNFPYRLRQEPGPLNALGGVKFMFPNRFDVYLHDTPTRELFASAERAFSSGCIRLERPLDLAEYLLGSEAGGWGRARLQELTKLRTERSITIPRPINVHLLYWTAWVDAEGELQFRRDLYDRDAPLLQALREAPPL